MSRNKQPTQTAKLLSADEGAILAAVANRIFPSTDTPGAVEIGALDYIGAALADDYAPLIVLYRQGLRAITRHAQSRFGRRFVDLTEAQMDAVLMDFESGSVPGYRLSAEFFETLRYHILEGVFCEPQYGGNRNMTGWRLVGFPGQQFGYGDAYINKPVELEPVAVDSVTRPRKKS